MGKKFFFIMHHFIIIYKGKQEKNIAPEKYKCKQFVIYVMNFEFRNIIYYQMPYIYTKHLRFSTIKCGFKLTGMYPRLH